MCDVCKRLEAEKAALKQEIERLRWYETELKKRVPPALIEGLSGVVNGDGQLGVYVVRPSRANRRSKGK